MPVNHSFLVAAICALPLSLAACGDSSDTITPEGTHYGYVVSNALVPLDITQVRAYGLDLGSRLSPKLDGVIDNALGNTLSGLAALTFDIQGTITTAVSTGSIMLLIDFQTKDFTNASASGFTVKIGATSNPPACSSPTDTLCRHHLTGAASFTVAADSPTDAMVAGKVVNGTFTGGPGDLALQIAIGSPTPIKLDLVHARVQASSITETGIMSAIIAGLVTVDQLNTQIGPAIVTTVNALIARDCPVPAGGSRLPPGCNCTGTGATVISALDGKAAGSVADCVITVDEVLGAPIVKTLLQADSCSKDSCSAPDSLSIGVKVEAVKATFPFPM